MPYATHGTARLFIAPDRVAHIPLVRSQKSAIRRLGNLFDPCAFDLALRRHSPNAALFLRLAIREVTILSVNLIQVRSASLILVGLLLFLGGCGSSNHSVFSATPGRGGCVSTSGPGKSGPEFPLAPG